MIIVFTMSATEYDLTEHNNIASNLWLASLDELYYYGIFKELFPRPTIKAGRELGSRHAKLLPALGESRSH